MKPYVTLCWLSKKQETFWITVGFVPPGGLQYFHGLWRLHHRVSAGRGPLHTDAQPISESTGQPIG